ncbi:Threonylcarbamoyl-AMP synthase [Streptomyces narbonensis]
MARRYDCNEATDRVTGLREAASAVRRGELVVLPTDTVYGIGADAFSSEAVADLLAAKGRGRNMPTPVLIGSPNTLHGLVTDFSEHAWELVDAFWPGALTLVAKHQPSLQWDLGDTRGTVAIRMPLHPVAIELLTEVGPMAVSSANLTGHPSPEDCDAAQQMLGDSVSVYLDGGPTPGIVPSSIVDVTGKVPVLPARGRAVPGGAPEGRTRPRGAQSDRRGPPHRSGRRGSGPQPRPLRRRRLRHHPQGPAWTARRHRPVRCRAGRVGSTGRCSRSLRAARRCTRSRPRRSRSARRPLRRTPPYAHQVVEHARVLAAALAAEGFALTTGGTDTHLITADPAPLGVDEPRRPGPAGRRRPGARRLRPPVRGGARASGSARQPSRPRAWAPRRSARIASTVHLRAA